MEELISDRLKALWQRVEQRQLSAEEFSAEQDRLFERYRSIWTQALQLEGHPDLQESLVSELALYLGCVNRAEIERRCAHAVAAIKCEWQETVDRVDRQSVEQFYDKNQAYLYELMWWHSLGEDTSPLAYVLALQYARRHNCRKYLDFGAGVGSGGILFARYDSSVALADISSPLLEFCDWRFRLRGLHAQSIDLKTDQLPDQAFDIVTAMDVFEHLVDPEATVEELARAIRPGGFLFGRFHAEMDEDRPQHIVQDFSPTFRRLEALGFIEVWRDDWIWGHQVFQKR